MTLRKTFVKFACRCANCTRELPVDAVGYFDVVKRHMLCESCGVTEQDVTPSKPTPQNVVEDKSSRNYDDRNERIAKAHDDNMRANAELCEAIRSLAIGLGPLAVDIGQLRMELVNLRSQVQLFRERLPPQPPVV